MMSCPAQPECRHEQGDCSRHCAPSNREKIQTKITRIFSLHTPEPPWQQPAMPQGAPGGGRQGPVRQPASPPASWAMAAERLMVLYEDDSVEVHYADGARLLLSPCGSEYLYEEALPAAAHPLQPAESTRQRVAFVLSAYRVRGGRGPADLGEGWAGKKKVRRRRGSECLPRSSRPCGANPAGPASAASNSAPEQQRLRPAERLWLPRKACDATILLLFPCLTRSKFCELSTSGTSFLLGRIYPLVLYLQKEKE